MIVAGYVGSLLLAGAYLAISCMTSAMTRNQVISFILSVVICLFLILVGFTAGDRPARALGGARGWSRRVAAFSVMTHFDGFQNGVLDSRDVVFFASVIGFALFTTGVDHPRPARRIGHDHEEEHWNAGCTRPAA